MRVSGFDSRLKQPVILNLMDDSEMTESQVESAWRSNRSKWKKCCSNFCTSGNGDGNIEYSNSQSSSSTSSSTACMRYVDNSRQTYVNSCQLGYLWVMIEFHGLRDEITQCLAPGVAFSSTSNDKVSKTSTPSSKGKRKRETLEENSTAIVSLVSQMNDNLNKQSHHSNVTQLKGLLNLDRSSYLEL
jgi:hypothetical protein